VGVHFDLYVEGAVQVTGVPHIFGRHIVGIHKKNARQIGKPAAAMDAIQPVVNACDVLDRTVLAEGLLEKK
jgi:hypothetical protein